MKLTTEQIERIDYVLKYYYSFQKFDDVRLELLDHIATDVETEMNHDEISFDDALDKVLMKWSDQIHQNRGSKYSGVPKIVARFWKKLDWKYNYSIIPLTILIMAILSHFGEQEFLVYIIYGIVFIGLLVNIYLIKLYRQNKFNTVLSIYASDQIYIHLGVLILGIVINIYEGDLISFPAQALFFQTTITVVLKTLLMRKNIKIENQLLKIN